MTTPTFTAPPTPAPTRSMADSVFDSAITARLAFMDTNVTEMTAAVNWMNTTAESVLASAIAGNLAELDLTALAGYAIAVKDVGGALEGLEIVETPQATQGEAEAGTATEVYMDPLRTKQAIDVQVPALMNRTGTLPMYPIAAWLNMNGTGTISIRASGGIASITDLGTGSYRLDFDFTMPDTNYAIICSGMRVGDGTDRHVTPDTSGKTTTSCQIKSGSSASNSSIDLDDIYVAIVR